MTEDNLLDANLTYRTSTFRALGHLFAVRTSDWEVGRLFDELYAACAVAGDPQTWYSIDRLDSDSGSRQWDLYVGEELVVSLENPSWLVRWMTWHVNRQVIEMSTDHVLLHAAMAACGDAGVLLPAESEAGKTTLVAGLVRSGFAYLTDEAAAVNPQTLKVDPYPKPLSIDRGSWSVLADLAPRGADAPDGFHAGQWHVSPASIRPNAACGSVPVAVILFPRYEEGAATRLVPLKRSEALLAAMRLTFRFSEAAPRSLDVLARVVQSAACFRLLTGNLGEACEAVQDLMAATTSARQMEVGRGA